MLLHLPHKIIFMKYKILPILILLATALNTSAQDRVFTNVYQSNVLPAGVKDLEYKLRWKTKRTNFYNALQQRVEFELGLGKNLQTSLYLNFNNKIKLDESTGEIVKESSVGFSSELKWKLSDPSLNKIGSALYFEIGGDGAEWEFEAKLIFDKQINKHLLALNLVEEIEMETEIENNEVSYKMEFPVKIDFGYLYACGSHVGFGIEAINFNDISPDEGWESSLLFAGPVLNFHGDGWYINLSCLPQIRNLRLTDEYPLNMDLISHERFETRLLLSFSL